MENNHERWHSSDLLPRRKGYVRLWEHVPDWLDQQVPCGSTCAQIATRSTRARSESSIPPDRSSASCDGSVASRARLAARLRRHPPNSNRFWKTGRYALFRAKGTSSGSERFAVPFVVLFVLYGAGVSWRAREETMKTHYGGQALIEGVLIRGRAGVFAAVRAPDGHIVTREMALPARRRGLLAQDPGVARHFRAEGYVCIRHADADVFRRCRRRRHR